MVGEVEEEEEEEDDDDEDEDEDDKNFPKVLEASIRASRNLAYHLIQDDASMANTELSSLNLERFRPFLPPKLG